MKRRVSFAVFAVFLICLFSAGFAQAQSPSTIAPLSPAQGDGTMLLTVFLRHDQAKNLNEINDQLWKNGYFDKFPPEGVEVVSWTVAMGIGQIITLRFPPEKLRAINVALEQGAWGPYRT
ncbi:MAG TPA: hypothetical protein VFG28_07005, partial [Syntrophales bacterium]|nr:hypothetical protein [Syntrophales bacterium]